MFSVGSIAEMMYITSHGDFSIGPLEITTTVRETNLLSRERVDCRVMSGLVRVTIGEEQQCFQAVHCSGFSGLKDPERSNTL